MSPTPHNDKLTFATRSEAKAGALELKYKHATQVKPYKCQVCGLWHLTST